MLNSLKLCRYFAAGLTTLLVFQAPSAIAAQCAQLAQLAQQSAAYYRNSGDQHHYAAARNYQNAYNGCVSAVRQRTQAVTGTTTGGGTAFDFTMNVLSTLNSLSNSDRERRAHQQAVAAETKRQQELVRRQEAELQRQIEAARQAREKAEREARERERQHRAKVARLRSRCARDNPFGRNAEACAGEVTEKSPFARRGDTTNDPFAEGRNNAPNWERGRTGHATFDSVNGIDCPEMFVNGCVPDSWRQMLARLDRDFGGSIDAALLAAYDRQQAAQSAAFLYMDALTEDQYRRLGTGEATFADIAREKSQLDFEPVSLASLEEKLAAIENDPATKRAFQKALREAMDADR